MLRFGWFSCKCLVDDTQSKTDLRQWSSSSESKTWCVSQNEQFDMRTTRHELIIISLFCLCLQPAHAAQHSAVQCTGPDGHLAFDHVINHGRGGSQYWYGDSKVPLLILEDQSVSAQAKQLEDVLPHFVEQLYVVTFVVHCELKHFSWRNALATQMRVITMAWYIPCRSRALHFALSFVKVWFSVLKFAEFFR